MRKYILWTVLAFCFLSIAIPVNSAVINPPTNNPVPTEDVYNKISSMKIKDIQKLAGRKLTLKEKIAFVILKHKLKHKTDNGSNQGKTAMTFGIIAVITLVVGLFVPYVIIASLIAAILAIVLGSVAKKEDPNDKKAFAARLMGWITLGVIALLLIVVAIIVASWSWF